MDKSKYSRWYLTLIAVVYAVICTCACACYAQQLFRTNGASVPATTQLICLGMAVSAILYLFRPREGRLGLIAATVLALFFIGTSEPKATAFHLVVLAVLVLPFVGKKSEEKALA
jgi:cell division protein FtsW (lipid II flippase)